MPRGTSNTISGTRGKTKKETASKRGGSTSPPVEKKAKLVSQPIKKLGRKIMYEKKACEPKEKSVIIESEKNKKAKKENNPKKISEDEELQKQKGTKDVSKMNRKRKADRTFDETKDIAENLKEDKGENKQLLKKRGRLQLESDVKEGSDVQVIEKETITKINKKDAKIEAGVYATRSNRRSASLDRENITEKLPSVEIKTKVAVTKNKKLQKNEIASSLQETKNINLSDSQNLDKKTIIDVQEDVDVIEITDAQVGSELQQKSEKILINEPKTRTTRHSERNISNKEKFMGKKQQNIDVIDSPDIETCGELRKSQGKTLPKVTKVSSKRQAGNYNPSKENDVDEKLQSSENETVKSRTSSTEKKEVNLVRGGKRGCTTRTRSSWSDKDSSMNENQSDTEEKNADDIKADCKLLKAAEKLDVKMLKARKVRVGSYSSGKESDFSDREQGFGIKDTVSSKIGDVSQKKEKKVKAVVHKTRQTKRFKSISSEEESDVNDKQHTFNLKDTIGDKTRKAVLKSKEKAGENVHELRRTRQSESFSSERESDFNEPCIMQMKERTFVRNKETREIKGKAAKTGRETRSTRRSESFSSERESDINEKSYNSDIRAMDDIKTVKEMQKSKGRSAKNAQETRSTRQSESFSSERESDINEKTHSISIEDKAGIGINKVIQKNKENITESGRKTRSTRQSEESCRLSSEKESDANEKQANVHVKVVADDRTKNKQAEEIKLVETKPRITRRSKSFSSETESDANVVQTSIHIKNTLNEGIKTGPQRKVELGTSELKPKTRRSKSFSSERKSSINEKKTNIDTDDVPEVIIESEQLKKTDTSIMKSKKSKSSDTYSSEQKGDINESHPHIDVKSIEIGTELETQQMKEESMNIEEIKTVRTRRSKSYSSEREIDVNVKESRSRHKTGEREKMIISVENVKGTENVASNQPVGYNEDPIVEKNRDKIKMHSPQTRSAKVLEETLNDKQNAEIKLDKKLPQKEREKLEYESCSNKAIQKDKKEEISDNNDAYEVDRIDEQSAKLSCYEPTNKYKDPDSSVKLDTSQQPNKNTNQNKTYTEEIIVQKTEKIKLFKTLHVTLEDCMLTDKSKELAVDQIKTTLNHLEKKVESSYFNKSAKLDNVETSESKEFPSNCDVDNKSEKMSTNASETKDETLNNSSLNEDNLEPNANIYENEGNLNKVEHFVSSKLPDESLDQSSSTKTAVNKMDEKFTEINFCITELTKAVDAVQPSKNQEKLDKLCTEIEEFMDDLKMETSFCQSSLLKQDIKFSNKSDMELHYNSKSKVQDEISNEHRTRQVKLDCSKSMSHDTKKSDGNKKETKKNDKDKKIETSVSEITVAEDKIKLLMIDDKELGFNNDELEIDQNFDKTKICVQETSLTKDVENEKTNKNVGKESTSSEKNFKDLSDKEAFEEKSTKKRRLGRCTGRNVKRVKKDTSYEENQENDSKIQSKTTEGLNESDVNDKTINSNLVHVSDEDQIMPKIQMTENKTMSRVTRRSEKNKTEVRKGKGLQKSKDLISGESSQRKDSQEKENLKNENENHDTGLKDMHTKNLLKDTQISPQKNEAQIQEYREESAVNSDNASEIIPEVCKITKRHRGKLVKMQESRSAPMITRKLHMKENKRFSVKKQGMIAEIENSVSVSGAPDEGSNEMKLNEGSQLINQSIKLCEVVVVLKKMDAKEVFKYTKYSTEGLNFKNENSPKVVQSKSFKDLDLENVVLSENSIAISNDNCDENKNSKIESSTMVQIPTDVSSVLFDNKSHELHENASENIMITEKNLKVISENKVLHDVDPSDSFIENESQICITDQVQSNNFSIVLDAFDLNKKNIEIEVKEAVHVICAESTINNSVDETKQLECHKKAGIESGDAEDLFAYTVSKISDCATLKDNSYNVEKPLKSTTLKSDDVEIKVSESDDLANLPESIVSNKCDDEAQVSEIHESVIENTASAVIPETESSNHNENDSRNMFGNEILKTDEFKIKESLSDIAFSSDKRDNSYESKSKIGAKFEIFEKTEKVKPNEIMKIIESSSEEKIKMAHLNISYANEDSVEENFTKECDSHVSAELNKTVENEGKKEEQNLSAIGMGSYIIKESENHLEYKNSIGLNHIECENSETSDEKSVKFEKPVGDSVVQIEGEIRGIGELNKKFESFLPKHSKSKSFEVENQILKESQDDNKLIKEPSLNLNEKQDSQMENLNISSDGIVSKQNSEQFTDMNNEFNGVLSENFSSVPTVEKVISDDCLVVENNLQRDIAITKTRDVSEPVVLEENEKEENIITSSFVPNSVSEMKGVVNESQVYSDTTKNKNIVEDIVQTTSTIASKESEIVLSGKIETHYNEVLSSVPTIEKVISDDCPVVKNNLQRDIAITKTLDAERNEKSDPVILEESENEENIITSSFVPNSLSEMKGQVKESKVYLDVSENKNILENVVQTTLAITAKESEIVLSGQVETGKNDEVSLVSHKIQDSIENSNAYQETLSRTNERAEDLAYKESAVNSDKVVVYNYVEEITTINGKEQNGSASLIIEKENTAIIGSRSEECSTKHDIMETESTNLNSKLFVTEISSEQNDAREQKLKRVTELTDKIVTCAENEPKRTKRKYVNFDLTQEANKYENSKAGEFLPEENSRSSSVTDQQYLAKDTSSFIISPQTVHSNASAKSPQELKENNSLADIFSKRNTIQKSLFDNQIHTSANSVAGSSIPKVLQSEFQDILQSSSTQSASTISLLSGITALSPSQSIVHQAITSPRPGPSRASLHAKQNETDARQRHSRARAHRQVRRPLSSSFSSPVRKYLEQFVPFLLEALLKVAYVRPNDPIQYLADWMKENKTEAYNRMNR